MMRLLFIIFSCFTFAASISLAQDSLPNHQLVDQANLLRLKPEQAKQIITKTQQIEHLLGLPVRIVTYPGLIDTNISYQADKLYNSWMSEKDGYIIAYDADMKQFGFGVSKFLSQKAPIGNSVNTIPTYELEKIASSIPDIKELSPQPESDAYFIQSTNKLLDGILAHLNNVSTKRAFHQKITQVLAYSLIPFLGILSWIVIRKILKRDTTIEKSFKFPDATIGSRLGAMSGGGKLHSRVFVKK